MVSEKKMKTNNEWNKRNYDRVSIVLPKGSKELIKESGKSLNAFICDLVVPELEKMKK